MSLFGGTSMTQNKATPFGGLSLTQPQQPSSSTFGSFGAQQQQQYNTQVAQPSQTTTLFGASAQPQQGGVGGLFGSSIQQQRPSLFSLGSNTQNPQSFAGSTGFGAPQTQAQLLSQSARPPLWQPGSTLSPREKNVPEQMQTLLEKWSPDSPNCLFQRYFYNNVQAETVPYYGPAPGEDEQKWEEALSNKPSEGSIPVLCKGFSALGNRLRVQVQSASALQARLHEINNSLTAMLQNHDLDISVRAVDARRRHTALSQRSLQLATKVQILRNRGYAMDGAEEELKKKLLDLERNAFDPQLSGRQEEIWARMVGVRERAKFLIEEAGKTGSGEPEAEGEAIDEHIMRRTKKILSDYDVQISHLQTEVGEIQKDYADWESGSVNDRARA